MFQIDRSANRLRKLERTSFFEVGFREREHLQEWLATMPDALCEAMSEGEDGLLIIQKEFTGSTALGSDSTCWPSTETASLS